MKQDITIGELAKLMHISTHQIRYFEEKEVLFPKYIDDNGYRMYGIFEIYRLAHILYLRELDMPVKDIRKHFNSKDNSHFKDIMQQSIDRLTEEIKALIKLKVKIEELLEAGYHRDTYYNKFVINQVPERKVYEYMKVNHNYNITPRDYLNSIKKHFSNFTITLADLNYSYICSEAAEENLAYHILPSGNYLCFLSAFSKEHQVNECINEFFEYANKESIKLSGKLICIEKPTLTLVHKNDIYVELQMLIET